MNKVPDWSSAKVVWIVGFALLWGIAGCSRNGGRENKSNRQILTVVRRDIGSSVLATGIVKPSVGAEVRVGSRVSGIVKRLYTKIGDSVQKGQLLAELDPTEFQAKFNQVKAALANATANLNYARLDLKRQHALREKALVSENDIDVAQTTFDVAEAQLQQAQANLDYAKIQLDYTLIRAPMSGVVATVSTQEGETVAASFASPTFVNIIDLDRLEVWAYVDETDIGRIAVGQKVSFTVDTYPDIDFVGRVTAIYPKAEILDNVVNYITIVDILDQKGKVLRPEMTTTVNILLETRTNVLAVPNKAIQREMGKKYVIVQTTDGDEKRWVTVGWKERNFTEIISGIRAGEEVVVGGKDANK